MIVLIRLYCLRCHRHQDYSCYCKILYSKIVFNSVNRKTLLVLASVHILLFCRYCGCSLSRLYSFCYFYWGSCWNYELLLCKHLSFILFDRLMLKRAPSLEKCSTVWAPSPLHSMLKMEISSTDSNTENAFCPSEMTFDKSKEMLRTTNLRFKSSSLKELYKI